MVNITSEQKKDNYRNMRSMINDYREQHNRFPTIKEFIEKLEMPKRTVLRYKKAISDEDTKNLLDEFQDDMKIRVKKTMKSIDKGIEVLEIISDNAEHASDRISATKGVIELNLNAIRIMRDGPNFLNLDYNVSDGQEHIHRKINSDRITEGLNSLS